MCMFMIAHLTQGTVRKICAQGNEIICSCFYAQGIEKNCNCLYSGNVWDGTRDFNVMMHNLQKSL